MDKSCKTNLIKTQEILIELAKKDKYIVATYRNQSISMQCKNETSSIQISGTNLLIMPEGCSLSTHKYQIFKKNVVKHEILESKITKIIEVQYEPLIIKRDQRTEEMIEELKAKIVANELALTESSVKVNAAIRGITENKSNAFAVAVCTTAVLIIAILCVIKNICKCH